MSPVSPKILLVFILLLISCGCGGSSGTDNGGGSSGGSGGGGGGTEGTDGPSGSSYPAAAEDCVEIINQYRDSIGLPPYERWTDRESCTDGEAESDAGANQPHGSFGSCGERAQNACAGWLGTPETMIGNCLKMMWAEGPGSDFSAHGHYLNMSSTSYTKVACGFYVTPRGDIWALQDFQ